VIAVSQHIARNLMSLGVEKDRILVNYDGVDLAVFCPGSKSEARAKLGLADGLPVILFVGNLVPVKATDVLLRAAEILAREYFAFRLFVVGEGPLRAALERQAKASELADQVQFVGSLPSTELPQWYRAADVFCLPSHSEGVPTVLLEASACGTPWVASRVGGIPEIAHLGVSRLVPPNAPADLAVALRATLTEPISTQPAGPRDRRASVKEMVEFFNLTLSRFRAGQ
jgi:glycosyltransferase involved in cell wall biosynthesis